MKFIEIVQQRFKALFNICISNDNIISGINQNNYITLAYLEELKATIEFINTFISIECDNSCPVTKDQSFLEFLFDSVDIITNTCLYLFKNGYQQVYTLCKPNSKLETLMLNEKITKRDLNEKVSDFNINNIKMNNINNFTFTKDSNIYRNLLNNNNENNNNSNGNENETNEDKTSNVFYFKLKTTLMMILFNISSCMIQLLNRNNFNIK
jgi:hypothetical protein